MMLGLGAVGLGIIHGEVGNGHGGGHEADFVWIAISIGIFHLFTHAFFKCLLFLGAGSVSHASGGTFDMRLMGGLRKYMPWTFATFLIGALSLSGIWPLAGFWSKDGIVLSAWEHTPVLFWLAIITVFMTAFYMFRAVFMTFGGEYRGGEQSHDHGHSDHGHGEPHESPAVMVFPMVILALFGIGAGWTFWGGGALEFLGGHAHGFFDVFTKAGEEPLPLIALAVGLSGIGLAYAMYGAKWISPERVGQMFAPVHTLLSRKYYMDELYENIFVVRILYDGLFYVIQAFDTYIVDGAVNGVARIAIRSGGIFRRLQTGQLQSYGLAIVLGVLIIMLVWFAYK
jgi:NADH-quinone oxidoreductase subunit L